MKRVFILITLIPAYASISQAEIWKCQKTGEQTPSYTDTPVGGEGIDCGKVETIRFTKTGESQARGGSSGSRAYSPLPTHANTKVKATTASKASKTTSKGKTRK